MTKPSMETIAPAAATDDSPRLKSAVRRLRLRELMASQEFVDSELLSRELRVSESTIRRDLIALEREGTLRRVHGGALSFQARDEQLDFYRLSKVSHSEKERIGAATSELIKDGQTLLLAAGSTVVEVARNLAGRPLQVVTNSIPVAQVFWDCKSVEVTMTGGFVFPRIGVLLGPICDQMLDSISADVLVMGIAGITEEGLSDSNTLIMGTMRKMIERARRVIIVADHTKFGRKSLVHIAPLSQIDCLVTDAALPAAYEEMLNAQGVQCILA
ncbi:MAG: DeoR/GlpR transcriptional regulator [Bryobacterales bacterium]|nr:DeoR/GlpR transcriptional regulator [Bryobacterales bacterium]